MGKENKTGYNRRHRLRGDSKMANRKRSEEVERKKAVECLAEMMHMWYLEACQKLDPENFNPKAQKGYKDLNEQQKNIDRYIANKVLKLIEFLDDE